MNQEKDPTLKDLEELIRRYVAANKGKVGLIINLAAFTEHGECNECDEESDNIFDENKSTIMAFGELDLLRNLCNQMRDAIEDGSNRAGWVEV